VSIEPRPTFQAYMGRVGERPAFQRMVAQNNELAEKVKAQA
jgi:hypothetical protein